MPAMDYSTPTPFARLLNRNKTLPDDFVKELNPPCQQLSEICFLLFRKPSRPHKISQ